MESLLALGGLEGASTYKHLTDANFRPCLYGKFEESKEIFTLDKLDRIIAKELQVNMSDLGTMS